MYAHISDNEAALDFAAERDGPSSSSRPPLPPSTSSLDAEQTQCSLREITRLINANKQTTALRQPQMKADLYPIDKRRSSFNLPVCPARCRSTPPPLTSTHSSLPLLPISALAVLLGWAQRQGKPTDASIIRRSALLSLLLCLAFSPRFLLRGAGSSYSAGVRTFQEESPGIELWRDRQREEAEKAAPGALDLSSVPSTF